MTLSVPELDFVAQELKAAPDLYQFASSAGVTLRPVVPRFGGPLENKSRGK
jgi:hypothetical protein